MSYVLPLQLTPTTKAKAAILLCPGAQSFVLTIRTPTKGTAGAEAGIAGSIYYERGIGTGGAPQWDGTPRLVPPGTLMRSLPGDAFRVWSAAPDAPQFVQIEAD
ncbi:MAG: hypothetical protein JWR63_4292 [Conexibacter sp.]|nr:hypothetical protein [Conexibacter sp.]